MSGRGGTFSPYKSTPERAGGVSGVQGDALTGSGEGLHPRPALGTGLQLNPSRNFRDGDAQQLPYLWPIQPSYNVQGVSPQHLPGRK